MIVISLAISLFVRDISARVFDAVVAVVIAVAVPMSYRRLLYEEWLEAQPGGRGSAAHIVGKSTTPPFD